MITRVMGLALLSTLLMGASASRTEVRIVVVVNSANPVAALSRERLAKIFLREITDWDNGREILPVEQIDRAPARIAFARTIQNQSTGALKRYWQERIFSGNDSPPPERVTDAEVLTYVRSNPGAIGYVTEGVDLGTGVKAVVVMDPIHDATAVKSHS